MSMLERLVRRLGLSIAERALPRKEGALRVHGLRSRVDVRWAGHGIPYILAESAHDLFLAQGYLHARDRLFAMDLGRRLAAGRLSELLGDQPVPWQTTSARFRGLRTPDLDLYFRLLGLRRTAEASVGLLGGEAHEALRAYTQGVNAWIEGLRSATRPLACRLLGYTPDPWQPADSLSLVKVLAYQLSASLRQKVLAVALWETLRSRPSLLGELLPDRPTPDELRELRRQLGGVGGLALREAAALDSATRGLTGGPGPVAGSNWFAVAGSRSASGHALLANDPHLELASPASFYLNGLRAASYRVVGASVPGIPGVLLGRNERIAWGLTNGAIDDADLYLTREHPEDPQLYHDGEGWRPFAAAWEERIRVRGEGAPRLRLARETRFGPVLSDVLRRPASAERAVLSVRWTGMVPGRGLCSMLAMNRARGWRELRDACRLTTAPTQNVLYADTDGNIGYQLVGLVPVRPGRPRTLPFAGSEAAALWTGWVPFDELPTSFNPADGALVSGNDAPRAPGDGAYLSRYFDEPYRANRIRALLQERPKHTPESAARIQQDVHSGRAEHLLATLVRPSYDALKQALDGRDQIALNYLMNWDGQTSPDSVAASVFHTFLDELLAGVFGPILGPDLLAELTEVWLGAGISVDRVLERPDAAWFEGRSREALVAAALRGAVVKLRRRFPLGQRAWTWGKLHRLRLRHPLNEVFGLRRLFGHRPIQTGGDMTTVAAASWRGTARYAQTVGAALRHIVELGAPSRAWVTLPGGQSENPASPHHLDLLYRWAKGDALELPLLPPQDGPVLVLEPGHGVEALPPGRGQTT